MTSSHHVDEYLDTVCQHVRCKEVHPDIRAELESHLEELLASTEFANHPHSEAMTQALRQMGDPEEIGRRLNKVHRHSIDWGLVAFLFALALAGSIAQLSMFAGTTQGLSNGTSIPTTIIYEVLGAVAGTALFLTDYRRIRHYGKYIYFVTLLLMTTMDALGYHPFNPMRLALQNHEIHLFAISPFLLTAGVAGMFEEMNWAHWRSWLQSFFYLLFPIFLFIKGNANAHGLEYAIGFASVVIVSKSGIKRAITILGTSLALFAAVIIYRITHQSPLLLTRVTGYLHAHAHSETFGYWYVQAQIAANHANFLGHGFAASNWRLPNSGLNLTFNYLLYAFGWGGSALIVVLVLGLLYRITYTLRTSRDTYARTVGTGFASLFFFKFLYSIVMGLGLVPILAVHMPFISPAPDEFAAEMTAVGLLMSIYRMKNRISLLPAHDYMKVAKTRTE